jgi:hypothetical protein
MDTREALHELLRPNPVWYPAKTAPKDGSRFLAYETESHAQFVVVFYDTVAECFSYAEELLDAVSDSTTFDYWTPLPKPPVSTAE